MTNGRLLSKRNRRDFSSDIRGAFDGSRSLRVCQFTDFPGAGSCPALAVRKVVHMTEVSGPGRFTVSVSDSSVSHRLSRQRQVRRSRGGQLSSRKRDFLCAFSLSSQSPPYAFGVPQRDRWERVREGNSARREGREKRAGRRNPCAEAPHSGARSPAFYASGCCGVKYCRRMCCGSGWEAAHALLRGSSWEEWRKRGEFSLLPGHP